jgi:hypothetical protein
VIEKPDSMTNRKRILVAACVLACEASATGQPRAATPRECVTFGAERLRLGVNFERPLPHGLVFRMVSEGTSTPSQWVLKVTPHDKPFDDFMWMVSPPWQTAPQRVIGPSYGLTIRESMAIRRALRFVLSDNDYAQARAVYEAVSRGETVGVLEQLQALGKGTVDIEVTGYGIQKSSDGAVADTVDWITFKAVACVPQDL